MSIHGDNDEIYSDIGSISQPPDVGKPAADVGEVTGGSFEGNVAKARESESPPVDGTLQVSQDQHHVLRLPRWNVHHIL